MYHLSEKKEEFLDQINYLINKMQEIINNTEDYYGVIHESLPLIERNIELTKQETSILIKYFLEMEAGSNNDSKDYLLMAQALKQVKANFNKISKYLLDQNQINSMLKDFLGDETSENSFESVITLIKTIENKLMDVSEISLNSIIFSSRLGEQGFGFRVISDHIYKTSLGLEEEFTRINLLIQELTNWYENFQTMIGQVIGKQDIVINEYINKLDNRFSKLTSSIQIISEILKNLMDNAAKVVSPFEELMIQIQRQDILRQSMENNIKCLEIIREKYKRYRLLLQGNDDPEKILNHIVFIKRGMELIEELAGKMSKQLFISLEEITSGISEILIRFENIQEDARILADYFGKTDTQNIAYRGGVIDITFNKMFIFMDDFIKTLQKISVLVENLSAEKVNLDDSFEKVGARMEKVLKEVVMLNKIKLLAKIELARMNITDSSFGAQLEQVSEEVINTVSQNKNAFIDLQKNLKSELLHFDNIIVGNQAHINDAMSEVNDSIEALKSINIIMNQAVSALYNELHNLFIEIEKVNKKINQTETLTQNVDELLKTLKDANENIGFQHNTILEKRKIKSWEENDQELINLFNMFTSYLERFTAKKFLGDQQLDEGSEEGALVLF